MSIRWGSERGWDADSSVLDAERRARAAGHEGLYLAGPVNSADAMVRRGYLPVPDGWWRRLVPLADGLNRCLDDPLDLRQVDHATLLFVVCGGRVLLIHKRRGHGAGQVNGPGGRVEAGETPLAGAIREVREETGVVPRGVRRAGTIRFIDAGGGALVGHVYRAAAAVGKLLVTAEALPFWSTLEAIPYGRMWPDDRLWLPWLLDRRRFEVDILTRGHEIAGQRTHGLGPVGSAGAD